MSKSFFSMQLPVMLVVSALTIGLVAWKEDQSANPKFNNSDTVPRKEKKVRNLDDALEELDRGQAELEQSLKKMEKDFVVPTPPVPPIPPVDMEKVMAEVQKALKAIEPEKLKMQIEQSLKEINTEEMKATLAQAMKEIDAKKINAEVQASLAKVDMEKVKKELENLKIEMPKLQEGLKNIKPQIEESMKKAKEGIENAKAELKQYKEFEEGLEKDGLINKKGEYMIEHKEGKLYIDGNVQPESVYNKYRSFLEKHKKFTLKKTKDDFQLQND